MSLKLYDMNKEELMAINTLEPDGDDLLIRGRIYGAMPMTARLRPEEARKIFGLLSLRIVLLLLSMPFRASKQSKG